MNRVDTATAVAALPAQDAAVTPGYFSKGNPSGGVPATIPGQDWFNSVQEEIISVITSAGITLDRTKHNQLLGAINQLGYVANTGTANACVIAPDPAITAHVLGMKFRFKATAANTGAITLAVSGLSAKAIRKNGTTALVAGDIVSGQMVEVMYDGTYYQLLNNGQVTDLSQFAKSLTSSGYQKLPGGLILQWGISGSLSVDTNETINFPITFPTACLRAFVSATNSSATNDDSFGRVVSTSTTQITVRSEFTGANSSGTRYVEYLALGY